MFYGFYCFLPSWLMVVASVLLSSFLPLLSLLLTELRGWEGPMFSLGCARSEYESMLGKWWCNEAVVKWLLLQSLSRSSNNQQRAVTGKPLLFTSTQRAGIKNRPRSDWTRCFLKPLSRHEGNDYPLKQRMLHSPYFKSKTVSFSNAFFFVCLVLH